MKKVPKPSSSSSSSSSSSGSKPVRVMHWFRKGLRLHDNPALRHALEQGSPPQRVYPTYVLDGDCYQFRQCTATRAQFLLECLQDLREQLQTRCGSRLYVLRGDPTVVLPQMWTRWNITHLSWEDDETGEPYARERDQAVREAAERAGIIVHTVASETLYPLADYVTQNGGPSKPLPATMTGFQKLFTGRMPTLPQPLPAPTKEDFPQHTDDDDDDDDDDDAHLYLPPTHPTQIPWPRRTPRDELEHLWTAADCANLTPLVRGGESRALRALQNSLRDGNYVATFSKPHTSCTVVQVDSRTQQRASTTVLSPYLSTGCLSPRQVWYGIAEALERRTTGVKPTQPPVSLHGQLLWRDFNHLMAYDANRERPGSWGRMAGNKYCRHVPWDDDPRLVQAWKDGRTGFPWIDACMRQLATEGWIHHLGRHAVACFLTRGDLWQSWERGAQHFEGALLDADYALNGFNWLWLSCSGFFYQYFRCYSPISFQQKNDPSGLYIRKYVPELRNLPDKYIYDPWNAPPNVLSKAGITLGKDYPHPIVDDHTAVSKANMARMKQAYDDHKEREAEEAASAKKKARSTKS